MTFSQALDALKLGSNIQRQGWNGKGMYLYLNPGSSDTLTPGRNSQIEGISEQLFNLGDVDTITRLPNINMKNANGNTVTGWLASQTDILAEDWTILIEEGVSNGK